MTRTAIAAGCLAALLTLTACSSSSKSGGHTKTPTASSPAQSSAGAGASGATSAAAAKITIKNFGFSGALTVKPGEKVSVVNNDSAAHTLTDKATHKFDTGNIGGNGGTGTFTAPTKPGSYPFGCKYHPEMKGTLVVKS